MPAAAAAAVEDVAVVPAATVVFWPNVSCCLLLWLWLYLISILWTAELPAPVVAVVAVVPVVVVVAVVLFDELAPLLVWLVLVPPALLPLSVVVRRISLTENSLAMPLAITAVADLLLFL